MRTFCLLVLLATALAIVRPAMAQIPVVVELFTSEGCSSCPPADALLANLSRKGSLDGIPLILLGEHVDYWNYIGWTDRFSSAAFSQRQSDYSHQLRLSSVYTPQIVVDGHLQSNGSDAPAVYRNIESSVKEGKTAQIALHWLSAGHLQVSEQSSAKTHVRVFLAVTEDGLSTPVRSGENGGRTLRHAAVVRQLRELGTPSNGHFETTADIPPQPDWNVSQLKVAVFVQDASNGRILGAASAAYTP